MRKRHGQPIEKHPRGLRGQVDRGSREITSVARRVGVTPAQWLGWLIEFVHTRPAGGYTTLSAAKLHTLSNEWRAFLLARHGSVRRGPDDLSGPELDDLADQLDRVLNQLTRGGGHWDLPVGGELVRRIVFPIWQRTPGSKKLARQLGLRPAISTYLGPLFEQVQWSAADLIEQHGSLVLRCAYPACDKIVVRTGKRRDFCSHRCANLEMTRRLRTKRAQEFERGAKKKKINLDAAVSRVRGRSKKSHG